MPWDQRAFQVSGLAILPEMLGAEDVARLAERLTECRGTRRSKAGIRHLLGNSAVSDVASDPRILRIAQQVLGNDAVPFRATLFDKSPASNWLVAWHQDTALPIREKKELPGWGPWSVKEGITYAHAPANALESVVALRIHLDDSTAENGPLRVLPGTHTLGVLSDNAVHEIATSGNPVACLVPRGGVLVMKPLLIHASSKVQSEQRRCVLHIEYAASMTMEGGIKLAVA